MISGKKKGQKKTDQYLYEMRPYEAEGNSFGLFSFPKAVTHFRDRRLLSSIVKPGI